MFSEYVDFEIRIRSAGVDRHIVEVRSIGGQVSSMLTLPTADPTYQALADRLERRVTDEDMLQQLGQILFRAIFQGDIEQVYARTQGALKADQGLRLRLDIDPDDAEAGGLPWEFLADHQGSLAMLDAPIVRYLPQQTVTPTLKTSLPIKVLLTSALPQGLKPIMVEQELDAIQEALAGLVAQQRVQIVVEPHLTRSKLQQLLRQSFQVWHFAGHGGFRQESGAGILQLEDTQGDLESASARELGILLNRSGVRLIVLDACESGRLADSPFRSMAPSLIRAQIPAVVAMQFQVPDKVAQAFAGEFYRTLAEGFPIDACVTEGRKAVMIERGLDNADWGIPVVYTRAPDGKLFDLPKAPALVQPQPEPAARPADSAARQAEERATEIAAVQEQIKMKRRVLNERKLQEAKMGINTDPMIKIDIEDLERDLAKLQRRLQELGGV